ncbi:phosphoribosylamine--glycine ligase [Sanyastnella coralliicola]|uniref:phosphoribosylamine--glycine ligase n=1 Tax=Sanyastnella coralliicola TaxID=3069118 RepID=UPI0027BA9E72|nr:phosphoribosylamine--glycine ligase [Longitalea sp. SCSIO 12813]
MNVLILGSGGREHAIAWKVAQSSILTKLYVAPGNAGTAAIAENVALDVMDFKAVAQFALDNDIKIVVVGPEAPLVEGIADYFESDDSLSHICVIGPNKVGAQLEGSKEFAKEFMRRHQIPTARYKSFTRENAKDARAFLEGMKAPYVIKADGLAAGKGVIITEDIEEAVTTVNNMLVDKVFGDAGSTVVIEEFLKGIEVSMFVITDGRSYKILPEAKDYKRIGEGDTGPNTGGMGAISPVPFVNPEFMEKVKNHVIIPTIKGLNADDISYKGFIFFGLMKVQGDPYVIEYNCRLGDPETEVILPRIKSDLLHFFEGIATDTLSECDLEIDDRTATTVILASGGYPASYEKGKAITMSNEKNKSIVYHAGTKLDGDKVLTNGGRVMAVTSMGADMEEALEKSYATIDAVQFDGKYFRKDIGFDLRKVQTTK